MAEKTLKSPADKPAPKAPAVKPTEGVTRLKAWPKSVKPSKDGGTAQTETDAAANLAKQNAEAAAQAAADAGSSAPSANAPGYEAERPSDEAATSEDAASE